MQEGLHTTQIIIQHNQSSLSSCLFDLWIHKNTRQQQNFCAVQYMRHSGLLILFATVSTMEKCQLRCERVSRTKARIYTTKTGQQSAIGQCYTVDVCVLQRYHSSNSTVSMVDVCNAMLPLTHILLLRRQSPATERHSQVHFPLNTCQILQIPTTAEGFCRP